MASIAIMIGGAALNAAAFIGGNYLTCSLSGDGKAAQEEKVRHDKALEAYQTAYNNQTTKYTLYNQTHPDKPMLLPKEPKFSDFYQPSKQQKQSELILLAQARSLSATRLLVFFELF